MRAVLSRKMFSFLSLPFFCSPEHRVHDEQFIQMKNSSKVDTGRIHCRFGDFFVIFSIILPHIFLFIYFLFK